MKIEILGFTFLIVIFAWLFSVVEAYSSEEKFETGRFNYLHHGEKFYQYSYQPFGVLGGDSANRCHFTSDFVLSENSLSNTGHVKYIFPKDMIWPGGYDNSTFYIVNSPSFNFPDDNNFEKIIPTKTKEGDLIFEFELEYGLNTFVANSTEFWDSKNSHLFDCPNPFGFEKQDYEYYDFVYPLKVQHARAMIFEMTDNNYLCKPELVLIQKYDDSPACVSSETKTKLIERGWVKDST